MGGKNIIIKDKIYIYDGTNPLSDVMDYKIFCFNGEPHYIQVDWGRFTNHPRRNIYDIEWNFQEFSNNVKHPYDKSYIIPRPENLDVMLMLARKLSAGFPHLRVDLYNIDGKIYFGELTFFHGSGMVRFEPLEWDYKLGKLIKLK